MEQSAPAGRIGTFGLAVLLLAASSGEDADETGIIVAGKDKDS